MMVFADFFGDLCTGVAVVGVILAICFCSIVSQTASAAKKIVKSETAKEVGKGFLAAWIDDYFGKK